MITPANRTCSAVNVPLLPRLPPSGLQCAPTGAQSLPRKTCRRDCIKWMVKCKLQRRKSLVSQAQGAAIRMAAPDDLVKLPACAGGGTSEARRALRPDPSPPGGDPGVLFAGLVLGEA